MKNKKKIGRPKYVPEPGEREKVTLLKACGKRDKEIALVIGISVPTLQETFFVELNEGPLKLEAELLMRMRNNALNKSNLGAQKELLEKMGVNLPPSTPPEGAAKPKEPKLGKKEAALRDAETAHKNSDWDDLLKEQTSRPN